MHESGTAFEDERGARTAASGDAPMVPGNAFACACHSERCVQSVSGDSPSTLLRRKLASATCLPSSLCMLRPHEPCVGRSDLMRELNAVRNVRQFIMRGFAG